MLGDVIYPEGADSTTDPKWQYRVFSLYSGRCLGQPPRYDVSLHGQGLSARCFWKISSLDHRHGPPPTQGCRPWREDATRVVVLAAVQP